MLSLATVAVSDSIKAELDKVKAAYQQAMEEADARVIEEMNKAVDAYSRKADLAMVLKLREAKQEFERAGTPPQLSIPAVQAAVKQRARVEGAELKKLMGAYDKAIADYTRNKEIELAQSLLAERQKMEKGGPIAKPEGPLPGARVHYKLDRQDFARKNDLVVVRNHAGTRHPGVVRAGDLAPGVKEGEGFVLKGIHECVEVSGTELRFPLDTFTIAAWVKPTAHGTQSNVLHNEEWDSQSVRGFVLRISGGKPDFTFAPASPKAPWIMVIGETLVPLESWTHLAATFDGKFVRLYMNGAEVAATAFEGRIAPSARPVRVGNQPPDGGAHRLFTGVIDEVLLFERALTADEVTELARK